MLNDAAVSTKCYNIIEFPCSPNISGFRYIEKYLDVSQGKIAKINLNFNTVPPTVTFSLIIMIK